MWVGFKFTIKGVGYCEGSETALRSDFSILAYTFKFFCYHIYSKTFRIFDELYQPCLGLRIVSKTFWPERGFSLLLLNQGIIQSMSGQCWTASLSLGALPRLPKSKPAMQEMNDYKAYDRKVMILNHCLTLTRLYHEQGRTKRGEYYADLANQYYSEILDLARGCAGSLQT
jgi:hypothetical protein